MTSTSGRLHELLGSTTLSVSEGSVTVSVSVSISFVSVFVLASNSASSFSLSASAAASSAAAAAAIAASLFSSFSTGSMYRQVAYLILSSFRSLPFCILPYQPINSSYFLRISEFLALS